MARSWVTASSTPARTVSHASATVWVSEEVGEGDGSGVDPAHAPRARVAVNRAATAGIRTDFANVTIL